MLEPVVSEINKMTEDYKVRNLEIINSLNDDYIWFKQQSVRSFDLDNILTWLRDANNDKNKGLYVDKSDNKWISPSDVTKEKFEIEKHFTQAILDHVLNLEEVFKRVEKAKNSV